MPFVRRDTDGHIDAVYEAPEGAAQEEVDAANPELMNFLGLDADQAGQDEQWARSDRELARVTEDLIDVLIAKGVIAFTDLPDSAQRKLISRANLRSELSYVASLFTGDEDDFI